jgi:hypothetical protein
MKIKITEVNVQTGEETTFEREETSQEEATRLEVKARLDAEKAETDAKVAQRQALLNRLGITEEEARILLGGN